jgi:hypothetical protein
VENTLSNVGYMFAGIFVLFRTASWAGHLLAFNLVVLSIMSGVYHGTLAAMPQQLDVAWVYAVLLALSIYASFVHAQAERPFAISPWIWIGIAAGWAVLALLILVLFHVTGLIALIVLTLVIAGIGGLCLLIQKVLAPLSWVVAPVCFVGIPWLSYLMRHSFGWDSDAVFAILVALLIGQLALVFGSARALNWGMLGWELVIIGAVLVCGLVVRVADGYAKNAAGVVHRKPMCWPDFFVQPHALWHLLGAAALLLGYDLLTQLNRAGSDRPALFSDKAR